MNKRDINNLSLIYENSDVEDFLGVMGIPRKNEEVGKLVSEMERIADLLDQYGAFLENEDELTDRLHAIASELMGIGGDDVQRGPIDIDKDVDLGDFIES